MNNCWEFFLIADHICSYRSSLLPIESDSVYNFVTKVMRLTRFKLLKRQDWMEWQDLEFLQLNQYNAQGMFGQPTLVNDDAAVFYTVWIYNVKSLVHCKKACCIYNGSPCAGEAIILDEMYANCVNQTSSWIFYGITAAENLLVYRANVSNTFAEAPPPKQGFYLYPNLAFHK
jgi:hypothetical protein